MLLTAREVAEKYRVHRSVIYDWIKYGKLKAIYLPLSRPSKATKRNKPSLRITVDELASFNKLHIVGGCPDLPEVDHGTH